MSRRAGRVPRGTVDGMNITMYLINAILVLMVIRQIREHPLDARSLAGPAAWVAALVMMALADVLTRLVVIYLRGRRLTGRGPAAVTLVADGCSA